MRAEKFVDRTFGVEAKRVRVIVSFTPPTGVHEGRVKETPYAYQGQDVLRLFANEIFSFTMMVSRANGKDPFFDPRKEEKHPGDVDGEINHYSTATTTSMAARTRRRFPPVHT
mmetsp:Transcript_35598/g.86152  ORF Transcript_35598/g.86152 Transcript_35598/m.86152 type:complete len:113 (-) Transcript_35598:993-1331(-)